MKRRGVARLALAISIASCSLPAHGAEWLPIARVGDPVSGLGSTFDLFDDPTVLSDGGILFYGRTLANGGGFFRWSEAPGGAAAAACAALALLAARRR